jgi:hypothetical protein
MKKQSVLVVLGMMAVFLNVSEAYADKMLGLGAAMFWDGDGGFGFSAIMPQVGWTSAKRETDTRRATAVDESISGIPRGAIIEEFTGMIFDGFEFSMLFDLMMGFTLSGKVNATAGLTAEFSFLPLWLGTLGVGIGGGWGFVDWIAYKAAEGRSNPYGVPYARVTVPYILGGRFKTGVSFDYFFTDTPYTQFNVVAMLLF